MLLMIGNTITGYLWRLTMAAAIDRQCDIFAAFLGTILAFSVALAATLFNRGRKLQEEPEIHCEEMADESEQATEAVPNVGSAATDETKAEEWKDCWDSEVIVS